MEITERERWRDHHPRPEREADDRRRVTAAQGQERESGVPGPPPGDRESRRGPLHRQRWSRTADRVLHHPWRRPGAVCRCSTSTRRTTTCSRSPSSCRCSTPTTPNRTRSKATPRRRGPELGGVRTRPPGDVGRAGPRRRQDPPAQRSTRSARRVFQRLGSPARAFHLEVRRTRMRVLERPSPLLVALLRHQIDRLGHALVGRDARPPQVVEPPQDVVVPARGKRTLASTRRASGVFDRR